MDNESAVLFNYSKSSALLQKSFIKERAPLLFQKKTLSDLWTLLFKTPSPSLSDRELADKIEKKAEEKFINQYISLLKQWDNPPAILLDQLKFYELKNLKNILGALVTGEKECPDLVNLDPFSKLKINNWKDIKSVTDKSEYEWLNKIPELHEQRKIEFKLDLHHVKDLWKQIENYDGDEKEAHRQLFLDEFIMKNIIWALRLMVYYEMPKDEIINNLFYVTEGPDRNDPIASPVLDILNYHIDKYDDWKNWKYAKYLNPEIAGKKWKIDPVWIENKYSVVKQKNAFNTFHKFSLSTVAFVAWFKIKSSELNYIRTAVESLRLNINSVEAMNVCGIVG